MHMWTRSVHKLWWCHGIGEMRIGWANAFHKRAPYVHALSACICERVFLCVRNVCVCGIRCGSVGGFGPYEWAHKRILRAALRVQPTSVCACVVFVRKHSHNKLLFNTRLVCSLVRQTPNGCEICCNTYTEHESDCKGASCEAGAGCGWATNADNEVLLAYALFAFVCFWMWGFCMWWFLWVLWEN